MKLPIPAALLLTLPLVSSAPLIAASLTHQDPPQESTQDLRRELASVGKQMLEAERDRDRESFEKLEERLEKLMEQHGVETHDEAVILLRSVFEEFEPEALAMLDLEEKEAPARETQGRLKGLTPGLEIYMLTLGRYPTTEEGLQILVTGGEVGSPLIGDYDLIDGWGQPFAYKLTGDMNYELRSAGPDMKLGTADDVVLGAPEPEAQAPSGELFAIGTLADGDKVEGIALPKNGTSTAYRILRGKQSLIVINGAEQELFDQTDYPHISPSGNVVTYAARLGEQDYLVINDTKHKVAGRSLGGVRFVENSDIWAAPFYHVPGGMEWMVGNGEWMESHKEESYSPANVYEPVTSHDYHTLAVRVKLEDKWVVYDQGKSSPPSDWASQPGAIPGKRAVSYRYGNSKSTQVIVDGTLVGVHHWARHPIFSADGKNFAYVVSIGGEPTKHFNAMCNLEPGDSLKASILYGPAYAGGTYNVVFNHEVGPPFHFVKDPIFNGDGSSIAYAVQFEDGQWAVHHKGLTGARYDSVGSITFDRSGTKIAYVGTRNGKRHLITSDGESAAHDSIREVTGGSDGNFAYVSTNAEGKRFLTVGWSSLGPFDDISDVGFMPDGTTPYARITKGKEHGVIIGHKVPEWFEEVQHIQSTPDHPTPVYIARNNWFWHVVIGDKVGPAFEEVKKPIILGDGRVVYKGIQGGPRLKGRKGAPENPEEIHHVMVDGQPQHGCIIPDKIEVSPDGFRAYYHGYFKDGTQKLVEVGGATYSPKDAQLDFVMWDEDSRLIIVEKGEGYERLLINNITQPAYDDVSLYNIRTTPAPLTAWVTQDGKDGFASGAIYTPFFDFITDPIYSADGKTLACRGRTGDSWHLVIGHWSSERYDEVYAPRFTQDGKSVRCAVRSGSDLFQLTVNLSDISY